MKFPGKIVPVDLGENSYSIYIGHDIGERFPELFLEHCGGRSAVIITDTNVGPLYAETVAERLRGAGLKVEVITVPAGETSKRAAVVESIYDRLFDFAVERSDTIVALGGGVIGDLAGFVAATYKRGVRYVQYPTSLLAMVDSSIGGKTGINHPRGKNMIGAFYQPRMVFADVAWLASLPRRELGCGLAESVKHAVIRDADFFSYLEQHSDRILGLEESLLADLVARNYTVKAGVVSADEQESGLRGILNYGHTIGHVFETVLPERDYHHGEAVSLGMVAAGRLAAARNLLREEEVARCIRLQEAFGLPTGVKHPLPVDEMYEAMKHDKKVSGGKIRFVLATGIGSCRFVDDLGESEIKGALESLQNP